VPKSDKACPAKNNAVFFFQLILIMILYTILILCSQQGKKFQAPRMAPATIRAGVKKISSNVPAVCDVFAARIRACVARPGLQKCGGVLAWEWSEAE
jgi:hypothetical protein